jgi:flagellar basal body L-ring protein FlgH
MKKIIFISLMIMYSSSNVFPQVSLYDGRNPYANNYHDGDIIRIHVNNNFAMTVSGEWNRNMEVNLKLQPDKKNLDFLKESEESRNSRRQSKERQNVSEKFKFTVSAVINKQADGNYRVNANKTVTVDGKLTRIVCTGIINAKSIVNGSVNSDEIADLNLNVVSQPQPSKDETYKGPEAAKEGEKEQASDGPQGNFSKDQMKKYIVEYMKEVLGGLK